MILGNIEITPLDGWTEQKIGSEPNRDNLLEYQFRKIRELTEYIRKNSVYYRRKLKNMPIKGPVNPEDLALWPLTDLKDLQNHGTKMVCVSQDQISRVVSLSTSGTTGGNKRLWFTESDQQLTIDFFRAGMSTFTAGEDIVYIAMPGYQPGSIGLLLNKAINQLGARGIAAGPVKSIEETASVITRLGVTHFVGLPKQAAALASYLTKRGIKTNLKTFLLSGDYVPVSIRQRLQQTIGVEVYEHWGMTETGLGGGVFCEAKSGYHMREVDLYIEIIDPVSNLPVPDGKFGEIVITTLTRKAMPLFRYRTGDTGRWLTKECCCGSKLRLMDKVPGRINDYLILPDKRKLNRTDWEDFLYSLDNVIDYNINLTPLYAEIICLTNSISKFKNTAAKIFPGEIVIKTVNDWSFEGHQKGFWN